MVLNKLF